MSEAYSGGSGDGSIRPERGKVLVAADWLSLAAAPTFAVMALVTGVFGETALGRLCSAAHGASPLSGMALMYLLMGVFHSPPWLRLISSRRGVGRPA